MTAEAVEAAGTTAEPVARFGPFAGDGFGVRGLARELAGLASGLCQDAGFGLEVRGEHWSYDAGRRVLCVPERALITQGRDACAGRVANEVGHHWLTRHELFWIRFPSRPIADMLMEALEDGRVNRWTAARYPGVYPWFCAMHAAEPPPDRCPLPQVVRFAWACAWEAGRRFVDGTASDGPDGMDAVYGLVFPPAVADALARTREARRRYTTFVPALSTAEAGAGGLGARMAQYRARVWPELAGFGAAARDPFEADVQLRALEALDVARASILPVAAELYQRDIAVLAPWLAANPEALAEIADGCTSCKAAELWNAAAGSPVAGPVTGEALRGARRVLEALGAVASTNRVCRSVIGVFGAMGRAVDGSPLDPALFPPGGLRGAGPAGGPVPPTPTPRPPTHYDEAYAKVADQIERLVTHLDRVLRPRQRMRERAGYPSGRRVSLPKLMAFEADPRRCDELWMRSTIPERRRVVFSLLVDLSGSMRGENAEAALLGTVLLAETLARLRIPFAIDGFQDVLIPFSGFHEPFGPEVRDAIATMIDEVSNARKGGNNQASFNDDGPCLLEAADALLAQPAEDRILVVVSDGGPAGRRSTADDLHAAVASLAESPLELLGLGLGLSTEHVSAYYPQSVASIPLERFAEAIGGLIEARIVDRHGG